MPEPIKAPRRAYSLFTVKAIQDEQRIIQGTATTPTPDRYGDIVVPTGAEFALPLPALWQHDAGSPVGRVTEAAVSEEGIDASIQMEAPDADMPSELAQELDRAWQLVKRGLVRGLSIGFRPKEHGYVIDPDSYTFIFNEWEWLELSLVTIPANAEATISAVKHYAGADLPTADTRARELEARQVHPEGVVLLGHPEAKRVSLPAGAVSRG